MTTKVTAADKLDTTGLTFAALASLCFGGAAYFASESWGVAICIAFAAFFTFTFIVGFAKALVGFAVEKLARDNG